MGDTQPSVQVTTATLEEIEDNINAAQQGKSWSEEEVERAVLAEGDPTAIALLKFAKEHSVNGQYVASGRRLNPVMRLYVPARFPDGSVRNRVLFNYAHGWGAIGLYLNLVEDTTSPEVDQKFRRRLNEIFGEAIDTTGKEAGVSLQAVGGHLDEFRDLMLWIMSQISHEPDAL